MSRLRLHKSSFVAGAVAAVLLVVVEIPGRVVSGSHGPYPSLVFEHGWPWRYLRRETIEQPVFFTTPEGLSLSLSASWVDFDIRSDLPNWGVPWLSTANWRFWQADVENKTLRWDFDGLTLSCDIAAALIVVMIVVGAWEFRRRRRPRLLSFRLADMFIGTTAVCTVLGWVAYQEQEHQRESQLDADMLISEDASWYASDEVCIAPVWIRSLIGERFLPTFLWRYAVVVVDPETVKDANDLANDISNLAYLNRIEFVVGDGRPSTKPFTYSVLRAVKRLETLGVYEYRDIVEHDIDELAQLTSLRKLVIWNDGISPHILSKLEAELPHCWIVDFHDDW